MCKYNKFMAKTDNEFNINGKLGKLIFFST